MDDKIPISPLCPHCLGKGCEKCPKKKLRFASTEAVEYNETLTEEFLAALKDVTGIEPMFVSDMTMVCHFTEDEADLKKLNEILETNITWKDSMATILKKMRKR